VIGVANDRAEIRLGGLVHSVPARGVRNGPAQLAIRPNAIRVADQANGALPGRIRHAAYLGDHMEYEIETEVGNLFVVDATLDTLRAHDAAVSLSLADKGVALIAPDQAKLV